MGEEPREEREGGRPDKEAAGGSGSLAPRLPEGGSPTVSLGSSLNTPESLPSRDHTRRGCSELQKKLSCGAACEGETMPHSDTGVLLWLENRSWKTPWLNEELNQDTAQARGPSGTSRHLEAVQATAHGPPSREPASKSTRTWGQQQQQSPNREVALCPWWLPPCHSLPTNPWASSQELLASTLCKEGGHTCLSTLDVDPAPRHGR